MTLHVPYFAKYLLFIESAMQWFQRIKERGANVWQNTLELKSLVLRKVS